MTDGHVAKFSESPLAALARKQGSVWVPPFHWFVWTTRGSFYCGGVN